MFQISLSNPIYPWIGSKYYLFSVRVSSDAPLVKIFELK